MGLVVLAIPVGWAIGQSVDIGLGAGLSPCSGLGVVDDGGLPERRGACFAATGAFARAPLVLYEHGAYVGDVVAGRTSVDLAVAYGLGDRTAVVVTVGAAGQETDPGWALPGGGLKDAWVGVRRRLGDAPVGLRVDLGLPIGRRGGFLGEGAPRALIGLDGGPRAGRFSVPFGVWLATPFARGEDVVAPVLPSGARAGAGVALGFDVGDVTPFVATQARATLARAWEAPMSPSAPLEVSAGLAFRSPTLTVSLSGGRGVVVGAGSARWRVELGLRQRFGAATRRVPALAEEPPEEALPEALPDAPHGLEHVIVLERPTTDGALAVAEVGAPPTPMRRPDLPVVEIRFGYGVADPTPGSAADLDRLAAFLVAHPSDGPVLLEGYASREGSAPYNFGLALARATRVYQGLVERGVDPRHVVIRGLGELPPRDGRHGPDARRVEARWADTALPIPGTAIPAPWSPAADGEEAP